MRKALIVLLLCPSLSFAAPSARAKEEARLIKKFPKVFSRAKGKLTLTMEGGKAAKVLANNPTEGESYSEHHLFSYHPAHHVAVIQSFGYEGGDYTLLSLKTGLETKISQKPHWNKAGDFFASVSEGEYAEEKHGLQLGHCDGSECKLLLDKDGRYSQPKWTADRRFRATNRVPSADGGEGLVLKVRCTVQRKPLKATCVP